MTTPNPDIAAWARGQLSNDELEARTGLSPQQAQYTDDARAVWFADPLPAEDTRAAAFNQGWDAYQTYDGGAIVNPYEPGTSEYNFWTDGFTVAAEQAGEFEAD